MRHLPGPLSVLIVLSLLAGCGQQGPLYLPGNQEAAEQYDPANVYDGSAEDGNQDNQDANTPRGGEG